MSTVAARELLLQPIKSKTREHWRATLEEDLLSLFSPGGRLVMMVPRQDAVRHLRFAWDIFRGRTVAFIVVEGLKAHRFHCDAEDQEALLEWLPTRRQTELAREVQWYGAGLVLLGALALTLQDLLGGPWGLMLVLLGLGNLLNPRRRWYVANGALLLLLSLALLFNPDRIQMGASGNLSAAHLLATTAGILMVIWSVQQFTLLSPNNRLRAARVQNGQARNGHTDQRSGAVLMIIVVLAVTAGLFLGHLAALFAAQPVPGDVFFGWDFILFLALTGALAFMAAVLWFRRGVPYFEAKIAGQAVTVLMVVYLAGAVSLLYHHQFTFSSSILRQGAASLVMPWVWIPLILLVVVFNKWFAHTVDRELDKADH
ncbi:MAG: hypothetical protein IT368_17185 [Candidatus Hydrogenedentes bacterium]|nr:hypothetical protein [Candidatus Hydrogenedentota bacterium]